MTFSLRLPWLILAATLFTPVSAPPVHAAEDAFAPMLPIFKDPPRYPRTAFEQNIEGWVHAQFVVLKDGSVQKDSIVVLDEEPRGVFTIAAIRSAETLRFTPRLSGSGEPVDAEGITYLFRFVLRPPSSPDRYYSDAYTGRLPPDAD